MKLFSVNSAPAPVALAMTSFLLTSRVALAGVIMDNSSACLVKSNSSVSVAPQPTATTNQAPPSDGNFMFTVVNSHTAPVSTFHEEGAGSPTVIRNNNPANTIAPGETVTFAAPTGWSGRLAMFEDGYGDKVLDRGSLLEGSFMKFPSGDAVMALDVSYVDGFTVPMVCECNQTIVLGCNLNLNDVCPKELQLNAKTCKNPYRDQHTPPTSEENVFRDCETMAYTYPTDDLATKVDIAGCSRSTTCCIGTACKPHPGQTLCPAEGGYAKACAHL